MSTIKKAIFAILTVVIALGATACSSSASAEDWIKEVEQSGFSDPVIISDDTERVVMMATAGSCRLRLVGDNRVSRLYATIPGAPMGDEGSFIGDPSLSLLRRDKRFAACFPSGEQG